MGSKRNCYFICLISYLSFSLYVQGLHDFFPSDSLDVLLQDYAFKSLAGPRTGALHKASLPANLSGMEVSVARLRSRSFWTKGANFSGFHIPPRTIPKPYVRRLFIIFQNLGNWSSYYYHVPGYSMVTPVLGFMAYDASNLNANSIKNKKLKLSATRNPISIHFPRVSLPVDSNSKTSCAAFSSGGSVYLGEMTLPNVCFMRHQGHFAIVVPLKRRERIPWKLWEIGGFGLLGFVFVSLIGMVILRLVRTKKFEGMEEQTDESVGFETFWVGTSKMPSVAVIRTQPVLENGYVP